MTDPLVSQQLDGLAQAFLVLAGMLQRTGVLDEQLLQAKLRVHADSLPPERSEAHDVLVKLADHLLRDYFELHGKSEAELQAALKPELEP